VSVPLSLGFSCQTRFFVDAVSVEVERLPLDYCVITKPALLRTLADRGESFVVTRDACAIHELPSDGAQGVHCDGVFYWHDFPRDENAKMIADWPRAIPDVNAAYRRRWSRLSRVLDDPDEEKLLVLSNSQINLPQYAENGADFRTKFGLDARFVEDLRTTLDRTGVRNHKILLLVSDILDFLKIEMNARSTDGSVEAVFVGTLDLPTHAVVSSAVQRWTAGLAPGDADLSRLNGKYDDGILIATVSPDASIVLRDNRPWGIARRFWNGFLFAFNSGVNEVCRAKYVDGELMFSGRGWFLNGTKWTKRSDVSIQLEWK